MDESEFCEQAYALTKKFKECTKLLNAVGDENRQLLLCIMVDCPVEGSRVVDIAKKTNLSRPATSHHMQILKEAGIIKSRKEGTFVYYYFDPDDNQIDCLKELVGQISDIVKKLPDRSEK